MQVSEKSVGFRAYPVSLGSVVDFLGSPKLPLSPTQESKASMSSKA